MQPEASSRLINTFFDKGRVSDSPYQSQTVDFTPGKSFGEMAKIFLGLALGLAAMTLLSLLGPGGYATGAASVARRVLRSGRRTRSSSA